MGVRGRMRSLHALIHLQFGPGAALLPKPIKRIHLDFAYNWNNGHLGPRRFWRDCLPRLKFYNPMVSMTVQRTKDQSSKPVMTIYFEDQSTKTIDMQMKTDKDILTEFMTVTQAEEVLPNEEEKADLANVEQEAIESQAMRIRSRKDLEKRREAKRLVEQARNAVS